MVLNLFLTDMSSKYKIAVTFNKTFINVNDIYDTTEATERNLECLLLIHDSIHINTHQTTSDSFSLFIRATISIFGAGMFY